MGLCMGYTLWLLCLTSTIAYQFLCESNQENFSILNGLGCNQIIWGWKSCGLIVSGRWSWCHNVGWRGHLYSRTKQLWTGAHNRRGLRLLWVHKSANIYWWEKKTLKRVYMLQLFASVCFFLYNQLQKRATMLWQWWRRAVPLSSVSFRGRSPVTLA